MMRLLAIATLLSLASPGAAQESAGPLDGSLIQDIREARQDVRDLRKSISEGRDEAKAWREQAGELGRRFDGKFLDRISTLIWMAFWLLIVAMVSLSLACAAYGAERVLAVVNSIRDLWKVKT